MSRIFTHGNVEVQNIKVGDIHYEYEGSVYAKVEVITLPESDGRGGWRWMANNMKTGEEVHYFVTEGWGHYGPKLYDHEAYTGCEQV